MNFPHRLMRPMLAVLCTGCMAVAGQAGAQGADHYPTKPITYVVPFAAGGTTDLLGRLIGQRLSQVLGQSVVVENRAGAGGNIGSDYVAKAPADGYTLLGGTISSHAINVSLYPKMPYDPVKNFQPIALIGTLPNVLVVNANSPWKSVQDVVAAAKAKPGTVNFGSSGNGTSQHLAAELFANMAGLKMTHVPYKGSSQAVQALLGNQVDLVFENSVAAMPMIQSGKFRALATTGAKRAAELPDVPTMAESGLKGYEIVSWQAIFAPAGTPKPIVDKLSTEIGKIIQQPDVRARLASMGVEPSGAGPTELGNFQKSEVAKWANLIKVANIHLE
ncbi:MULTISPECIES: tripartite tricarboxylate transporter substrate binding protein [unclassified Cupriavidus]|uniref:Bug family tripartite tricarboxylate transporter substrate binding protein n=1 Tax=unclassified Cupriavidus TaxID=2640874 RepID=UPI001C0047B4|nr:MULTISPECIES: tripartite tricarboxylate transporter substrate binding protein [unclassified Cupriavidus]MCA3184373.1 tripartite tricarboxylate transporter substrate binding protein [Cupriavidus sp.]MCA3189615.1 tripartite tricarboxylate transporter substrate binding protein [Cupriavidus sp.]MCA3195747.1 tripartite tricarboxylate transporter substrate binding protein [Cupriavidus sp.]MCA3203905.1 tripartite tricarboxylate transporter substrate binding protein [Cupriavidus sp.]MCA3206135.1 tr